MVLRAQPLQRTDFRVKLWSDGVPGPGEPLSPHSATVVDALFRAAAERPELGITLLAESATEPEAFRSYAELAVNARRRAAALAAEGVAAGDRVMMALPTSFEFIEVFFAIQMLRAIPVPVYPPAMLEKTGVALEKLHHVAEHAGASAVVTNRKLQMLLGELATPRRPMLTVESLERYEGEGIDLIRTSAHDPALIQYTSGSTGRPKGVLLRHDNLICNIHASGLAGKVREGDVVASWLPLYHDMGLMGTLLLSIYWQLPFVLMSPMVFLLSPIRWLRAITDHRVTLALSPNFGYARCVARVSDDDMEGLDLSSLRVSLNGAEAVNHQTIEAFAAKFAKVGYRGNVMFPCYGLAEATVAVTFCEPGAEPIYDRVDRQALAEGRAQPCHENDAVVFTGCGRPVPGHDVAIVDDDGRVLADRMVGNIVVSGPSVMSEYYRDAEKSAETIRDGRLWTGDLGYQVDGVLFITGRVKDLILVRGKNYYAEDIEAAAETVDGVRKGCVVAFGVYDEACACDQLVLVSETRLGDDAARAALQQAIAAKVQDVIGLSVREVVLVAPGSLAKTSSGKRQRGEARRRYLIGDVSQRKTTRTQLAGHLIRSHLYRWRAALVRRWSLPRTA